MANKFCFFSHQGFSDEKNLIEYCKLVYDEVIEKCSPIIQAAKIIVNSILKYAKQVDLEPTVRFLFVIIIEIKMNCFKITVFKRRFFMLYLPEERNGKISLINHPSFLI